MLMSKYEGAIIGLMKRYKDNRRAVDVDFRELVAEIRNIDRATHLIHPYPAKLLAHIPYFLLNNNILSNEGELVYDPFSGSGTILLEAVINNRNAIGADVNPLARLLTKVKIEELEVDELIKKRDEVIFQMKSEPVESYPDVRNIKYWYSEKNIKLLQCLYESIMRIESLGVRDFFLICFSVVAKRFSYCDPYISVPVKMKYKDGGAYDFYNKRYKERCYFLENVGLVENFVGVVNNNIERFRKYRELKFGEGKLIGIGKNVFDEYNDESFADCIITSPPYATAQKYIRSSSLNIGWLRMADTNEISVLDKISIGRERCVKSEYLEVKKTGIKKADEVIERAYVKNPMRSSIIGEYLIEMDRAISRLHEVLKMGKYMVMVVGNSRVLGEVLETDSIIREMCERKGFDTKLVMIDRIKSRSLLTKRKHSWGIISHESIMVFKKAK